MALGAQRNFAVGFSFSREMATVIKKAFWRSQNEASQNLLGLRALSILACSRAFF